MYYTFYYTFTFYLWKPYVSNTFCVVLMDCLKQIVMLW